MSRLHLLSVLLFVGALVLAGCASKPPVGDGDGGPTPTDRVRLDPPVGLSFSQTLVLGTVTFGAEPSVATAPDGYVYVTTPLALWRSADGGSTYEQLGEPLCPFGVPACPGLEEYDPGMQGGGDADLTVSGDGRLHWLGLAGANQNAIPYQYSDDRGDSWSDVVDLAGEDDADREWIVARPDGALFAAWRNFPAQADAKIVSRVSFDNGATWSNTSAVADDTRQGGIAIDPTSDLVVLPYDAAGHVQVAYSSDNATTWESVSVSDAGPRGHIFPVAAIDGGGTIYLVWAQDMRNDPAASQDRSLEVPSVYLSASQDGARSWSDPLRLNPEGTAAIFPWVAAGAEGRIVVVWYENLQGTPLRVGGQWHVMSAVSLDADYPDPRFTVLQVTEDPVHVGPLCTSGGGCNTGADDRSFLDFFEVALHPDGYPVIAWAQDADAKQVTIDVATSRGLDGPDLFGRT